MLKQALFLLIALSSAPYLQAQAPRYVLMEHFTNTNCGSCAGNNPTFYNNISIDNNSKLHHISIHPSIPYSSCVLYQANPVPQNARANFYTIPGTPTAAINGASPVGVWSITASTINDAYCASCSPVAVVVNETDLGGSNRRATIRVQSVGTPPSSSHRLYVAVVEKRLNLLTSNGERIHHNTFRQFLTASSGDAVSFSPSGSATVSNYDFTINNNWVASDIYVLAWVQDETTRSILNSGTRFDASLIPVELSSWSAAAVGSVNVLSWTTQTESNTDYFEIEKSTDGQVFKPIGQHKAVGQSVTKQSYRFEDDKQLSGIQLYRLKTVDKDGTFARSAVVTLKRSDVKGNLSVFPSPTRQTVTVSYLADKDSPNEFWVLDALGRIVFRSSKRTDTEGGQKQTLNVSNWAAGVYTVQWQQKGQLETARFVKLGN